MSLDLCISTRAWIARSACRRELVGFCDWLDAERYSSFVADQHVRRIAFMLERLSPDGRCRVYLRARADLDLKRQALSQVFPDALAPPRGGRLILDGSDLVGWLRRL